MSRRSSLLRVGALLGVLALAGVAGALAELGDSTGSDGHTGTCWACSVELSATQFTGPTRAFDPHSAAQRLHLFGGSGDIDEPCGELDPDSGAQRAAAAAVPLPAALPAPHLSLPERASPSWPARALRSVVLRC